MIVINIVRQLIVTERLLWVFLSLRLVASPSYSVVTDELSSSGDSKADDDADKKSPKDKDSKDRERDREEGSVFATLFFVCAHYGLPYVIGQTIVFLSCYFLLSSSSFFSSPNHSSRRLDVYHTLAHGVALVRI